MRVFKSLRQLLILALLRFSIMGLLLRRFSLALLVGLSVAMVSFAISQQLLQSFLDFCKKNTKTIYCQDIFAKSVILSLEQSSIPKSCAASQQLRVV